MPSYSSCAAPQTRLSLLHRSLLESEELPFTSIFSDEHVVEIFEQEGIAFAEDDDDVYTPVITLWALLSQVFFKEEQRSCLAAVVRVAALWLSLGRVVSSVNTGAYCRARKKIAAEAIRKISGLVAAEGLEQAKVGQDTLQPDVGLGPASEYLGGRLIMVDGFTVTAADTEENQAEYPQNPAQKEGLGFPILRGVVLTCIRTGLILDAEVGPYSGKETGETALLRKLLDVLRPGDILVADSYYCSYCLLAACLALGVHVVMRNHHRRDDAPVNARRLVKGECIATWVRPPQPEWMDDASYAALPATIDVRLVESHNDQPGQRTEKITIATTLLDHKLYDALWLAGIYRGRWRIELDIRAIKATLGMDIIRAKTPAMVRTELWSCLLAYNLLRKSMLNAALSSGRTCRSLSLTAALQMLGNLWLSNAIHELAKISEMFVAHQIGVRVGNRPGRNEPRVNKRRPKILALMTEPRPKRATAAAAA